MRVRTVTLRSHVWHEFSITKMRLRSDAQICEISMEISRSKHEISASQLGHANPGNICKSWFYCNVKQNHEHNKGGPPPQMSENHARQIYVSGENFFAFWGAVLRRNSKIWAFWPRNNIRKCISMMFWPPSGILGHFLYFFFLAAIFFFFFAEMCP